MNFLPPAVAQAPNMCPFGFAEAFGSLQEHGGPAVTQPKQRGFGITVLEQVMAEWDRQTGTIVNNESSEIIRMFGRAFDQLGARPGGYYPEPLRDEIDALNSRIYDTVSNGVYRAGFATTQEAYAEAIGPLFDTLDELDHRLATRRFLTGDSLTEADIRLFTALKRFDAVYVGHFKCNLRRIMDYPNLLRFRRELYAFPGIAPTVNFQHIKGHYYESHRTINPTGIVPIGPDTVI